MTIRRWATLLTLIAAWTVQASHLPVLGGEITASAAKVFLTAAAVGEKPASEKPTAAPAAVALPVAVAPSTDAHSAAAVPPTLDAAAKPVSPNVLRPTPDQQEARVTPITDG